MRVSLFFCAALIALAGSARADDKPLAPEAKAHLDKGLELYGKKQFSRAIQEFEQGYAIDPKPAILYALAQAERLDGQCSKAIDHYQQFLDTGPAPEREAAARANLARCKDLLAAEKPDTEPATTAPPPAPTTSATPAPAPTPAPVASSAPPADHPPAAQSPWYTDAFGDVLVGTGVVVLGASSYFFVLSRHNESDARADADAAQGGTYQEHLDRVARAERQRTIAVVGGSVGLGLIAAGVVRYVLRDPSPDSARVGGWVAPRGGGIQMQGRF